MGCNPIYNVCNKFGKNHEYEQVGQLYLDEQHITLLDSRIIIWNTFLQKSENAASIVNGITIKLPKFKL